MPNATPTGAVATFPGRNSLIPASDLKAGLGATIAQNCLFGPGGVETRPGFSAVYFAITGSPSITGIVRTARLNGTARVLLFGSNGALIPEASEGVLGTNIESALGLNLRMVGTGLAGRSILAFSDFQKGLQPVFYYDEPPTGAPAQTPNRAGVPAPPAPFSCVDGAAGAITAGSHQVCAVARSIQDGSVSSPSASRTLNAAGAKKATVTWDTGILAPPDFVFDIYMTTAGGAFFFFTGTTVTGLTAPATIDASDSFLNASSQLDYPDDLFNRFEPPAAAGVFGPYHGRVCLTGLVHDFSPGYQLSAQGPLRNLNFVYGSGPSYFPDWTFSAGGSIQRDTSPNGASYWTYAKIVGDGVSATRGSFFGPNFQSIITPQAGQIGLRVRARKTSSLVQGDLFVELAFGGAPFTATVPNASLTTNWQTFEVPVFFAGAPLVVTQNSATFPLSIIFQGSNTPTNLGELHVDYIHPYSVTKQRQPYTARWSFGGGAASGREFDSAFCDQTVGYGDGEDLIGGFELGGRWYYWKKLSLWVTADNGNEPAFWPSPEKIANVGSASLAGVSRGEEWVVILSRPGLYFFQGGGLSEENRLSEEITPDWDTLNWDLAEKMWVQVDTEEKLIWCGVIVGAATEVNQLWVLDYREGFGDPSKQNGFGRKWSFWTFQGTCAALIERASTGTRALWIGNNLTNGKVYNYQPGAYVDDGATMIQFIYETGNFVAGDQPGFMGNFTKISLNCDGFDPAGQAYLDLSYTRIDGVNVGLPSLPIYDPSLGDPFTRLRFIGERMRVRFGTSIVNRRAHVHGLTVEYRKTRFRSSRLVNP
jgi:hypothetical protein